MVKQKNNTEQQYNITFLAHLGLVVVNGNKHYRYVINLPVAGRQFREISSLQEVTIHSGSATKD